jgi:hypothetical protein
MRLLLKSGIEAWSSEMRSGRCWMEIGLVNFPSLRGTLGKLPKKLLNRHYKGICRIQQSNFLMVILVLT